MKLKHLFILSLAAVPGGALAADPQVDIKTNVGTIRLELYPARERMKRCLSFMRLLGYGC